MAAVEVTMATPTSLPLTVVYLLPLLPQFDLNVDRFHERVPLYVTLNKKRRMKLQNKRDFMNDLSLALGSGIAFNGGIAQRLHYCCPSEILPLIEREREAPEQKIQSLFNGLSISKLCPMFVHIQIMTTICTHTMLSHHTR